MITRDFHHYRTGPEESHRDLKGYFGASFEIKDIVSGKIRITTNLWSQGMIPEHLQRKFIPNAEVTKIESDRKITC